MGVVLFCILLGSIHLMGGLYARYTTQAGDSDSARVAVFSFEDDLSEQGQLLPASFSPGESLSKTIEIHNNGETALKYVIKLENLTQNLPIEDKIIETNVIACGEESSLTWSIEWLQEDNSIDYMGKMDILRITVTVEQVD